MVVLLYYQSNRCWHKLNATNHFRTYSTMHMLQKLASQIHYLYIEVIVLLPRLRLRQHPMRLPYLT
jgi:hypothetical protein